MAAEETSLGASSLPRSITQHSAQRLIKNCLGSDGVLVLRLPRPAGLVLVLELELELRLPRPALPRSGAAAQPRRTFRQAWWRGSPCTAEPPLLAP